MASPPFNPAENTPGDTDVAANYPAAERTFRDVMESWMLIEHDRYGHTTIGVGDEATRDTDPNWSTGSLWYNTDTDELEVCTDDSPSIVWTTVQEFDSGTRVVLQQTAAPTGYTKEVGATFHDYALRLSTGTVGTGGSVDFSTFLARTATDAHTLTEAQIPAHRHFGFASATVVPSSSPLTASNQPASVGDTGDTARYIMGGSGTEATIGRTSSVGGGTSHTHNIDCRIKYRDVCIFVKD